MLALFYFGCTLDLWGLASSPSASKVRIRRKINSICFFLENLTITFHVYILYSDDEHGDGISSDLHQSILERCGQLVGHVDLNVSIFLLENELIIANGKLMISKQEIFSLKQ